MQATAVGTAAAQAATPPRRGMNDLKSEDFFKILVAEMQQQDPFEPTKTADMIGQVSQIRSIELSGKLTDTLEQLTRQQRILGAADLIGKFVTAVVVAPDGSRSEVSGVVTGVRFDTDGSAVLELDSGQAVPAASVQWVTTVDEYEAPQKQSAEEPDTASDPAESQNKANAAAKSKDEPSRNWLSLDGSIRL